MNGIRAIRRSITRRAKNLAYSQQVRDLARKVLTSEATAPLRKIAEDKGLDGQLRRYTSETLPKGKYFAKLTITDWQKFNGQPFRLCHGDEVVYGNEIEPPARGFPLEYRNIVVDSAQVSEFHLDIDSRYTLQIGRGFFSTPQQVAYDEQYKVEQHGDVYYSLRGNTTNPTKLLLTFPGFGPSTSRVSYAVSYLKALTETDLSDTVMVCFQDRYLAAGSYMLIDSAGNPLLDRVNAVIDDIIERFSIAEDRIMLFGASKGGSIAIQYAEKHPQAHIVVAVPQMNIRYYLDKPFFRDNLFQERSMHAQVQPEQLLRTYFRQGRTIDYFYTASDEQSNYSLIEMAGDVPGLTKYRINGRHGDVARAALPTTLGIIRRFLGHGSDNPTKVHGLTTFPAGNSLGIQARIDDAKAPTGQANWYLEGTIGRTRFRQILSDHSLPFVKYTNEAQQLRSELDDLEAIAGVVAYDAHGGKWSAPLPQDADLHLDHPPRMQLPAERLRLHTDEPMPYVIVRDETVAHFTYVCQAGVHNADRIDIHLVEDISTFDLAAARHGTDARFVAAVAAGTDGDLLELMIQRLFVASNCAEVRMCTDDTNRGQIAGLDAELDEARGADSSQPSFSS